MMEDTMNAPLTCTVEISQFDLNKLNSIRGLSLPPTNGTSLYVCDSKPFVTKELHDSSVVYTLPNPYCIRSVDLSRKSICTLQRLVRSSRMSIRYAAIHELTKRSFAAIEADRRRHIRRSTSNNN